MSSGSKSIRLGLFMLLVIAGDPLAQTGGDVWVQQDDGQYYPHEYRDVQFISASEGRDVGHGFSLGGTILHTTDAGTIWLEQEPDDGQPFNAVHFVDADHGWAVGGDPTDFPGSPIRSIEHTSDGGATWHSQHHDIGEYPLRAVHFADLDHGWAVGHTGDLLRTTNGGQLWSAQGSGTTHDLNGVFFVDTMNGWCVGDLGTIRHSTDGGATWHAQSPGSGAYLNRVFIIDATTGWEAGVQYIATNEERPAIYQTTDAGATWYTQDPGRRRIDRQPCGAAPRRVESHGRGTARAATMIVTERLARSRRPLAAPRDPPPSRMWNVPSDPLHW
ncbi:MAG: YCF48-related protein [Candidatus Eiseniibacteriota bacterium]|jgi:photosystem II stability/assembly factor-like uncharacterized protein